MESNQEAIRRAIELGQTTLGIEMGSTRIKAVLIGPDLMPVASGGFDWENNQVDGIWTYSLDEVWQGVQGSFSSLLTDVRNRYGLELTQTAAIGISGMMHGYLAFDRSGNQLVPFRTWRNTITGPASEALTALFNYPIPQRWSIAHLYQAILKGEEHVKKIDFLTTLAGYVHWKLTGEKVVGVGEASGMFPIDLATKSYHTEMANQFDALVAEQQYPWTLMDILPRVLVAGEQAGVLTQEGARLIDPTGKLQAGIPFCPPEGDAGTGMVATNSIAPRTGNVSAGTSVFATIVLEKELTRVYSEIDQATTPDGSLVAMVHSNNCTSDYDAWIGLMGEAVKALGFDISKPRLYDTLLGLALEGDPDCGGLLAYNYLSGEHITGFEAGRPLFVRSAGSAFNLSNFIRVQLSTALGSLHTGLQILLEQEGVHVDQIKGHGGFFKTKEVGQRIMAAATGVPVSILETAGEGGAWGIALLAAYSVMNDNNQSLPEFLNQRVFAGQTGSVLNPFPREVAGFKSFMARYHQGLLIERAAVDSLH